MMQEQSDAPLKDEDRAHPIAGAWRPTLRKIANALVAEDYGLSLAIPAVVPVTDSVADHIRSNVSSYGERLIELPDDTWDTSVAQWMVSHWDVLVDLWTIESGASDLVLHVRVFETRDGFEFVVDSVHVP